VTPAQEQAFTEFVRANGDALLRYARLLVPDNAEAEDLLQTALLRLARHWPRDLSAPTAYLRAALVNLARDRARRRHLVPVPAEPDAGATADGSDHAEAIAARARLDAILGTLPIRQRITVVLRVIEGLSEAETAEVMGCAAGTVKSNLARGLEKVRAAIQATFEETGSR